MRKQGCAVVPAESADALWEVAVLDPSDLAQMESVGQPVPANTFLSVIHTNTQTPLFTSDHPVRHIRSRPL